MNQKQLEASLNYAHQFRAPTCRYQTRASYQLQPGSAPDSESRRSRICWDETLFAEVSEQPEKERKNNADDETGDDGKVERGVFAAMNDIAWQAAETQCEFAAEIEESAESDKKAAEDKERAAEVANGIHKKSLGEESREVKEIDPTRTGESQPCPSLNPPV